MLCDRSTAMIERLSPLTNSHSVVSRSRWGNSSIAEATKNWGSMFQEPGTWCCRKSINHYPFKSVWIRRNFGSGFGTSSHSDCNNTIHSKLNDIFEFQGLPSKRASRDFLLLRAPKLFHFEKKFCCEHVLLFGILRQRFLVKFAFVSMNHEL